jgi:hypothetical protein
MATTYPNLDSAAGVITYAVNDPQFSYLRVEPLIDQAIDILERALRTRADYDVLAAKLFDVQLASLRDSSEIAIEGDEISSGYNALPIQETNAEIESQKSFITDLQQSNAQTKALLNYLAQNRNKLIYAAHAEAGAMRLPWKQADFDDGGGTTGVPWPTAADGFVRVVDVAQNAAEVQTGFALDTEQYRVSAQDRSETAMLDQARERLGTQGSAETSSGLYAKLQWNQLDAQFRAHRRDALDAQQQMRASALTAESGAINFQDAMNWLIKRYKRDFADACARLTQVSLGLRSLYGYVDQSYARNSNGLPPEVPGPRFDMWLIWVRDAASWLIRFSQTDQQVVVPISLKDLLKDEWNRFMSGQTVPFQLDSLPMFPTAFSNVRMRGLSVFSAYSSDDYTPLQMIITPPTKLLHTLR